MIVQPIDLVRESISNGLEQYRQFRDLASERAFGTLYGE